MPGMPVSPKPAWPATVPGAHPPPRHPDGAFGTSAIRNDGQNNSIWTASISREEDACRGHSISTSAADTP
jgi:hypothetical protein